MKTAEVDKILEYLRVVFPGYEIIGIYDHEVVFFPRPKYSLEVLSAVYSIKIDGVVIDILEDF